MHESNTFASRPTDLQRFREGSLTYADAVVPVWQEAHHEMGGFIEGATRFGYELVPVAMAWATPSGPVTDEFFDSFTETLTTGFQRAQPDGILLALHGAMVTPKHPDADAEVLRRLRAAIGPNVPLAVSLDFHGNVSPQMADTANILVGYQTYPHVDQRQRGRFAAELLTRTVRGEVRPVCFVAKPPMLLNLLGQDTNRQPMKELMGTAREMEKQPGVLSVSLMAGFPYADVPDVGASVIVVSDGNREQARTIADELATEMWNVRARLNVPCPLPEEAVQRAIASTQSPPRIDLSDDTGGLVVQRTLALLVDLGDNVGGGSAGDGTVLLAELLKQKAKGFIVVLHSPAAVEAAKVVGISSTLETTVGGSVDKLHGEPVHVRGVVKSLHDGKWVEPEARHGGRRQNDQGHTAVLDLGDNNLLVLNTFRTPPFSLGQLTSLGIDPRQAKIIVVKAAVAYKAAYAPLGGEIIEVDTPGLTAINPARFEYKRIRRPLYPLE
ncbi:MAG: M81 family metallopeptidase [Planctomycetia bacterium]|nr:M81 family metallopeptidase [Planctomycetia bacterium]